VQNSLNYSPLFRHLVGLTAAVSRNLWTVSERYWRRLYFNKKGNASSFFHKLEDSQPTPNRQTSIPLATTVHGDFALRAPLLNILLSERGSEEVGGGWAFSENTRVEIEIDSSSGQGTLSPGPAVARQVRITVLTHLQWGTWSLRPPTPIALPGA